MSGTLPSDVVQIGEVVYSQENHNRYWSAILRLASTMPSPVNLQDDAFRIIPEIFAEVERAFGSATTGYVFNGQKWKNQAISAGQKALWCTGSELGPKRHLGSAQDWTRQRLALADEVIAAAQVLGADCVVDIGAGPAVIATCISARSPLPIVNLEASQESLAMAEIIKRRHDLPWTNVRMDLALSSNRPEALAEFQRILPGSRPLLCSRGAIYPSYTDEQFRRVIDWFLSIGAVGGVHLELLGQNTEAFKRIRQQLHGTDETVLLDRHSHNDPFAVMENHPSISITKRQEIWPQFVSRDWWSLLCWRRKDTIAI